MKATRILSLLLAVLTVATLLCACKPDDADANQPTEPTVTTLNLVINGETSYVIVHDYNASAAVMAAVDEMAASIEKNIGATVSVKECYSDREDSSDVKTDKEILIGKTNRQESTDALKNLRSNDFTVCASGTKLIIGGGGDEGTLAAITRFIQDFIIDQGNPYAVRQGELQNLIFSSEKTISQLGNYSYTSAHILGVSLDNFGIIYPKGDADAKDFANKVASHISVQSGYGLETYQDTVAWCDFEIRIGKTEGHVDKHDPDDGCQCKTLSPNDYCIKLVKTKVTYEDGSIHDGARLYICYGRNAKDAALTAFTTEVMPMLKDPVAFTMDEGFELTNRTA